MTDHQANLARRMAHLSRPPAAAMPARARRRQEPRPAAEAILLRPAQAAQLLNVSEKTLLSWNIPRFEFHGVRGYRPCDLQRFVAQHVVVESRHTDVTWEPV